jgi:SAM-dependent methyltransferase
MSRRSVEERQQIEIDYWRTSKEEAPGPLSIPNLVNKMGDAQVFFDLVQRYGALFPTAGRILELGGGQGWAACMVKRLRRQADVTTTDISPYALEAVPHWERVFDVRLDHRYACKSYETREPDAAVDLAFTFASAHHFIEQERTFGELSRILKPGGVALYLYEPTSNQFFYPVMHWRVNKNRPAVPEDVLVPARLKRAALASGLDMRVDFYPSLIKRGRVETLYYTMMSIVPALSSVLPCSANIVITKPVLGAS